MKKNKLFRITLVVLFSMISTVFSLSAQNIVSSLEVKMVKQSDESRIFNLKLTGESEEGVVPVSAAKIMFSSVADGKTVDLGSVTTDKEGKGLLLLPAATSYLYNKEGQAEIKVHFEGSGKMNSADATVKFSDLKLQISLEEKDSLNTIQLHASAKGPKGETIPLKETNFNIYIQGLFSKLKIGECFVDAGVGTFEFPKNIPGDENGNLKIFVRLEENEQYGEVEQMGKAKWGNHRSGFTEPTRSLWSSGAPIWMITTLIILLAGVWSHYIYAIIQLIKIRKEGKKIGSN